ncbi:MAG: hypothetical protein LBC18_13255, partial [Opitutaceae bacterium]|nr:hypothetical protein [Opitutaceae bacterium]
MPMHHRIPARTLPVALPAALPAALPVALPAALPAAPALAAPAAPAAAARALAARAFLGVSPLKMGIFLGFGILGFGVSPAPAQTIINLTTGSTYARLTTAMGDTAGITDATLLITADQTLVGYLNYDGKNNTTFTGSLAGADPAGSRVTITTAGAAVDANRFMGRIAPGSTITLWNLDIVGGAGTAATSSGAFYFYGSDTGTTRILGDFTIRGFNINNQGAVIQNNTAGNSLVLGSPGARVELSDNHGASIGGAIRFSTAITFDAAAVILANTSTGAGAASGGALWANNIIFNSTATLSRNILHCTADGAVAANNGGGALYAGDTAGAIRFAAAAVLSENVNRNGTGGALYTRGRVEALAGLTLTSNTAARLANTAEVHGGAAYIQGGLNVAGALAAAGNSADGSGGALYLLGGGTMHGGSAFLNNTAGAGAGGGNGGAIYWAGPANATLALIADTADITFSGNTAAGAPHAIFWGNSTSGRANTLALHADAARAIRFLDPVTGAGPAYGQLNTILITGAGETIFDTHKTTAVATTTIAPAATLRLANDATFGNTGSGTLALAAGARLAGSGTAQ